MNGLHIGTAEKQGRPAPAIIPDSIRDQHIYIAGKTRRGKSTLIQNMVLSDLLNGYGLAVIDPHGDLIEEQILPIIPENRIEDVILFDPNDTEYPIGFNMFRVSTARERQQMRSDIPVAIERLTSDADDRWTQLTRHLFRVVVAILIQDEKNIHTLLDVRRILTDKTYLDKIIGNDEFWNSMIEEVSNQRTIDALLRRLNMMLLDEQVRDILCAYESNFNFREVMDERKIFLANLSTGNLGEHISGVFGSLLISKMQLTAMSRANQKQEDRVPFALYVDEFQNFVGAGFDKILSEAGKYKLYLTVAHQFVAQLAEAERHAIFGNVGTFIIFNLGYRDANAVAHEFTHFTEDEIVKLPPYHTFTRIGEAHNDFSMTTLPPPEVDYNFSEQIKELSRDKYCRKEEEQVLEKQTDKPAKEEPQFYE
ncbi:type IV secretion system DNA-binding domain-containing protein [Patescibacteria group bacterium]|nr:type IV secretion system DNA-binding domain-containing protein [Patescibacteria group bacterium]